MFIEKHGESWKNWVEEGVSIGCDVGELKNLMIKGGWSPAHAEEAIREASAQSVTTTDRRRPEIVAGSTIYLDGHPVTVVCRLDSPSAVLLDNLVTEEEADALLLLAESKGMRPSGVVSGDDGTSIQHEARTSSSAYLKDDDTPLLDVISNRIAKLTNWPRENSEQLQLLRYEEGQEYKPHYDWFSRTVKGSEKHLSSGGQRVGTTVIYLQEADEGGYTRFPRVGFEVSPKKGSAIFFANVDSYGKEDTAALHAGTPVIRGVKIVLTCWQRERSRQS